MSGSLSFHPVANIFPLLDGEEFEALSADIRAHGLREPIVLHDGMILDGRNRYRACLDAGVDPRLEQYRGADPVAFVVSLNLRRRHLDESQRGMVAAKLANLEWGDNQHTGAANLPLLGEIAKPLITQSAAAGMLNVSERTVRAAKEVRNSAIPELVEKVERGEVSVSAAALVAKLPDEEQREIAEAGPAAVKEVARDIRENGIVNRTSFTGNNEWFTPDAPLAAARAVLGAIDLDPASHPVAQERVKAARYFTEADDGLAQEWRGRVWLNPPYAQPAIEHFTSKMVQEVGAGRVESAIMLTHNYTDTLNQLRSRIRSWADRAKAAPLLARAA
jgi:DNA N-6-adenine-methyltransferase Dam